MPTDHVLAAGGVVWRESRNGLEIALVHRPRYDDWSLPKGKVDEGEDAVLAALREIQEETGVHGFAGRYLGASHYKVSQRGRWVPKTVHWWAVHARGGSFAASKEVDEMRWCSPEKARALLTAGRDAEMLDALLAEGTDVSTAVLLRHAAAGSRTDWAGKDEDRPLTAKGRRQAEALADQLSAFGVTRIVSAPPLRCRQTVEPLAERHGLTVEVEPLLGEAGHGEHPDAAYTRLLSLLRRDGVILSSQGGALPVLLARLRAESGLGTEPVDETLHTRKAAAWVLSLRGERLVAADHRDPPP